MFYPFVTWVRERNQRTLSASLLDEIQEKLSLTDSSITDTAISPINNNPFMLLLLLGNCS